MTHFRLNKQPKPLVGLSHFSKIKKAYKYPLGVRVYVIVVSRSS